MTPSPENRPRQATLAGWLAVLGAAFSVVTAFQVVSGARSLETREAISDFLADQPGSGGLGVDVEGAVRLLQLSASVAAVVGAMMVVLGVYALRGDRRARLGLTVLAVPLFVSGLALGGFLTSLAAAATVLLWISPTREWYAGRPIPGSPGAGRTSGSSGPSPWSTPPSTERPDAPSDRPDGSPANDPRTPYDANQWTHQTPQRVRSPRPGPVTMAVAITLIVSGLVLVMTVVGVAAIVMSPDLVLDEMRRADPALAEQGIDRSSLMIAGGVMGVLMGGASLLAIGLATIVLGRRRWAAVALLVMSATTAVLCASMTIFLLPAVVPAVAAIAVISCLVRGRAWFEG